MVVMDLNTEGTTKVQNKRERLRKGGSNNRIEYKTKLRKKRDREKREMEMCVAPYFFVL